MIYETIYAYQDVQHDTQAGLRSLAVRLPYSTKSIAAILTIAMVGAMALVG